MKKLITISVLALSFSSFGAELKGRIGGVDCSISGNGTVTRTQTFGKDQKVSFTETKTITMKNLDSLIPKVLEVSREGTPSAMDEFAFALVHEGKSYLLNINDSTESMFLVRMIGQVCR